MKRVSGGPAGVPEQGEPTPLPRLPRSPRSPSRIRIVLWILGIAALVVIALVVAARQKPSIPAPTLTLTPAPTSTLASAPTLTPHAVVMQQRSWILRPTLPATATQADRGAQVYRLVCSTCHGFGGEGLSYGEWVKTAPPNENCWQAKCHGGGHPVEGFALPHTIPPVVGSAFLSRFKNALALYNYTRRAMPWYAPGSMLDEEYWEVTAYLVRTNGLDPILTPLDPQRAARLVF
jgi:mono/diheme cytochrome c family protein